MQSVCLTGGIATGKSTFLRHWLELVAEVAVFDSDAEVHSLLHEPPVIEEVVQEFGGQVLSETGAIDRAKLREIVFHSAAARLRLERLLHPKVRLRCRASRDEAERQGAVLFVADVPLLYESGFDLERDYEIVVAASPDTQRHRLCEQRGLELEMAERIMAAQWPILRKIERASIVIWNEGTISCLKRQAHYLSRRLGLI